MITLGQLATLVRSKNAGPFWITIDIFCDTAAAYHAIATPGVITADRIAALYRVEASAIKIFLLDDLRAVKISFPRPAAQGSACDRDMHSGQQYVSVMNLSVSDELG